MHPEPFNYVLLPKRFPKGDFEAVTLLYKYKEAMKLPEIYKLLPIEEKIEILMRRGEFAMSYENLDYETWLYAMDGQFIEIVYSIVFNRIEDIRVLEDESRIDKYLENIDITDLICDL